MNYIFTHFYVNKNLSSTVDMLLDTSHGGAERIKISSLNDSNGKPLKYYIDSLCFKHCYEETKHKILLFL